MPRLNRGMKHTPEYVAWIEMRRRCRSRNRAGSKNYANRGITVCERWNLFSNFLEDMGKRPSSEHSLERKDNSLGYSPDNCIWGTHLQQNQNRRLCRYYTINGKTQCLAEWVREYKVRYSLVQKRLDNGYDIVEALTKQTYRPKKYTVDGITGTMVDLCLHFGMKYITVYNRVKRGIPIDKAIKAKGVRI